MCSPRATRMKSTASARIAPKPCAISIFGGKNWRTAMADRKPRANQVDALRAIISEARLACEHPNSSPDIAQVMLTRPFLRKLVKHGCRMQLLAAGINAEIRRYLKDDDDGEVEVTADQLEFWPERHRAMVRDIDRRRIFVPSCG